MLKRIFKRNLRQPLFSLAVILFATALAVVLCQLHQSEAEEMRSFEETYASVPVVFSIVELDGTKPSYIKGWVADLFTDRGMTPNLAPFVKELHTRVSYPGEFQYTATDSNGNVVTKTSSAPVTGITSTYVAEELTPGWGGKIYWHDGYDESVLQTEETVCLVPEFMQNEKTLKVEFETVVIIDGVERIRNHTVNYRVVGYYVDPGNSKLYCPYAVMRMVHARLAVSKEIEEQSAVLNDNDALDQLYEAAADWFAKPNPAGEKTEWGKYYYTYYLYALDIDDTMLRNLESNMRNSMRLNTLASAVVFALSAGAGFLTGFLVIRSRKREIALMRTMGTSQVSIYFELASEQLVCIAFGLLLGGSYSLWAPMNRLMIFGCIYYIGLTMALVIFLRKNLLTTIKEEE